MTHSSVDLSNGTEPRTHYARSGTVNIAYQVVGNENAPIDLVFVPGWISHIEYMWEDPGIAHYLRRLASFSRLIIFDKRGTGLSDRDVSMPGLEERMDDVRAVMDTVGSERAALFWGVGGRRHVLGVRRHVSRADFGAGDLRLVREAHMVAGVSLGAHRGTSAGVLRCDPERVGRPGRHQYGGSLGRR